MILALIALAQGATVPAAETPPRYLPVVSTPAPVQSGSAAPPAAPPAPAPQRMPIEPAAAVALFKSLCLPNLLDAAAFAAAVTASADPAFTSIPRRDGGAGQTWRADRALLTYGQARDGATRCTLVARATGNVDQLGFSARVAEALALRTGRTRTGRGQAVTDWSAAGPDGRTVRISAATRNAAGGGGTDLRLSAAIAQ